MTREAFLDSLKTELCDPKDCEGCSERADCEAAGMLQTVSFFELTGGVVQVVGDEDGDSLIVFDMNQFKFNDDGVSGDTEDEVCVMFSFPFGQILVVDMAAPQLRQAAKRLIISKDGKEIGWFEEPALLEL